MREIKFRQPKHYYITGDLWHYWGYVEEENKGVFISPLSPAQGGDSFQFTGLKDRHGVEIYEGDLVEYIYETTERGWEVVWDIDRWWLVSEDNIPVGYYNAQGDDEVEIHWKECKIIGNKYEGIKKTSLCA